MHGLASQFGRPLVATVVLALLAVAVAGWRGYRARSAGGASIRPALQTLAIGSGIAVIVATALPRSLSPRRWGEGDLVLEPGRGGLADLAEGLLHPFSWAALLPLLNVAVYVPFGFFAALAWPDRKGTVVASAFVISLFVETMQLLFMERFAATDDVILNVAGALIGVAAAVVARRTVERGSPAHASD